MTETQKRIKAYKAMLPGLKERVLAVALLLVVSLTMMTSATFAWLTISRAPEVTGVSTTVAANGNLEIALVNPAGDVPGESRVGDSSAAQGQSVVGANITWGNLVNLSDESYGLENIVLRPALLGNTNNLLGQPLKGVVYGQDGRAERDYNEDFQFTNWVLPANGVDGYFKFNNPGQYGVRAISTVKYTYVNNSYYQYTVMMSDVTNEHGRVGDLYNGTEDAMLNNDEYINALAGLIGDFMTDKLNDKNGSTEITSYMPTLYALLQDFEEIAADFGNVIVNLVNTQVYNKYKADYGVHLYKWEDIFEKDANGKLQLESGASAKFANDGVSLTCLNEYIRIVNKIDTILYGDRIPEKETAYTEDGAVDRANGAESFSDYMYRIDEAGGYRNTKVQFKEVTDLVNSLVDIGSCQVIVEGTTYTVNGIGMGAATKLLGKDVDAVVTKGLLKDFEQFTGYKMCATDVTVEATYVFTVDMTAKTITTNAKEIFGFQKDQLATQKVAESDKGDYTGQAQDTYGLAVDLWARTNIPNSYLVLEGNVLTKEEIVDATGKDADGNTVYLFSLTRTVTTWYNSADHAQFELNANETPTAVTNGKVPNAEGEEVQSYTLTRTENGEATTYTLYRIDTPVELTLYQGTAEDTTWYDASNANHPEFPLLDDDNAPTETSEKITVGDKEYPVYQLVRWDESNNPTTYQIYPVVTERSAWFNAETYDEVDLEGATPTQKIETIVTVIGYEGENRVWDKDYEKNIWLSTDSTTQGSGSCYVFYAEDPDQQENSLRLLSNLRVGFIDAATDSETYGKLIAIGKLNIKRRFEESGKVTLPLELYDDGSTYLTKTENGMAIMPMEKNKATRLMVIVYLDGRDITNADVLAANDIQGRLNIQFGTDVPLATAGDTALESAIRSVTARAKKASDPSYGETNTLMEFDYDKATDANPMTVNVRVKVTGDQPAKLTAFFMRQVNSTQGSREPEFRLYPVEGEEGIWEGSYTFLAPGDYVLRTVRLDGVDYDLPVDENGDKVFDYPQVSISGFKIDSVNMVYNGMSVNPVQTIMTSDRSITAELSVKLKADQLRMPNSVRLQFVKTEDNSQVTTTMTYDATSASWKGTANFTSSGEYILSRIVMNGEYFPVPETMQRTVTMYIGMTVSVEDDGSERNHTLNYGDSVIKPMYVHIYDNTGKELTHLSNAKLIYNSAGVRALDTDLKWDPDEKCFTGRFQIVNPGIYTFGAVTVGTSYLENTVNEPPEFTCMSPEPPVYVSTGPYSEDNDYILDTGATVYLDVLIDNALGATVNAVLHNSEASANPRQVVKGTLVTGSNNRFRFKIPETNGSQVGNWTITELRLHNVYDENKAFHDSEHPIVWTLDPETEDLNVEIVSVKAELTQRVAEALNGGQFMGTATAANNIKVKITDHNGGALKNGYQIANLQVRYGYVTGTSSTYGHYTSTSENELTPDIYLTQSGVDGTEYSLNKITLGYAGEYTPKMLYFEVLDAAGNLVQRVAYTPGGTGTVTVGDQSGIPVAGKIELPQYSLETAAPTVTVAGVNPGTDSTHRINTSSVTNHTLNGNTYITGKFNHYSTYVATVYIYTEDAFDIGTDWNKHNLTVPTVTLRLEGVPTGVTEASMVFGNAADSTYAKTFNFDMSTMKAESEIGYAVDGEVKVASSDVMAKVYPAGKQTVSQIAITYNGKSFTVNLSHDVTINQPQYPPYVAFKINDSTYTGDVPTTVYSSDGETVTLTLPTIASWSYSEAKAGKEITDSDYVATGVVTSADDAYTSDNGGLFGATRYYGWKRTYTQQQAVSTGQRWTTTKTIAKWKIDGTEYTAGATVTLSITGAKTATAVIETVKTNYEDVVTTYTRDYVTFSGGDRIVSTRNRSSVSSTSPYYTTPTITTSTE